MGNIYQFELQCKYMINFLKVHVAYFSNWTHS